MKKAFALILALAMVMSLAAVSFAANFVNAEKEEVVAGEFLKVYTATYAYNSTSKAMAGEAEFEYGDTVYLIPRTSVDGAMAYVTEAKTLNALKLDAEWSEGAEFVKSVEIVKKKVASINGVAVDDYIFLFAVGTQGSATKDNEVVGTIFVKGRSGDDKAKIDGYIDLDFTLGYDDGEIVDKKAEVGELALYEVEEDGKHTFEFGPFEATVNMKDGDKVLLECDDEVIDEVDEAYPDANIDYYACTAAFKKTATVVVELEEGEEYLYEVVDGVVVEVNGEYDDWAEEFTFKTKKLGTYIISDVELEVGGDVVATNPSTGAAA